MENTKKTFDCQCGNKYVHSSSLCVHHKKCSVYQEYKLANPKPIANPNPKPNVTLVIQEKDDISILSSTSTDSSLARVLELENQLKITELKMEFELRLKNQEMENILKIKNLELENCKLTFQLQAKELENIVLNKILESQKYQPVVQVPVQQPIVQEPVYVQAPVVQQPVYVQAPVVEVQPPIQSPVQVKPSKASTLDFLNSNLDESYTIEDCFDILKNPDYNHYLYEDRLTFEGVVQTIINPKFSLHTKYQSSTTNAVDIIAALLHKFKKEELPFYVCKKNKKSSLYIKTNNGWIKDSEKDTDDLLVRFCDKALKSVSISILNTYNIFKKAPSKYIEIFEINKENHEANNFDKWQLNHKSDIMSKLMIFKEDFDLATKKLKSLLIKMDPNNQNDDDE
jgi:hypothetical protein